MNKKSIITLDIGGTKVNFGRFKNGKIEANKSQLFCADQSAETILQFLVDGIKTFWQDDVEAIAIGVPTILDIETGVVFDAVNIPAWKNYSLKAALAEYFDCDIYINNDVNCFVAGEVAYGQSAKHHQNVVGMCLGTGLGIGISINNRVHAGHNCSAGELGSIPYLNGTLDDYCSGSFFINEYGVDGATLAEQARAGDEKAITIFNEFAQHIAQAIRYLLFVIDPEVIVLGGSASKSFDIFIEPLNKALSDFPFQRVIDNLKIVPSYLDNAALLGAANLYLLSKN